MVQAAAMAACDTLDGVADKVVSNVEGLPSGRDAGAGQFALPGGTDTGDTCLSDAQIATSRPSSSRSS